MLAVLRSQWHPLHSAVQCNSHLWSNLNIALRLKIFESSKISNVLGPWFLVLGPIKQRPWSLGIILANFIGPHCHSESIIDTTSSHQSILLAFTATFLGQEFHSCSDLGWSFSAAAIQGCPPKPSHYWAMRRVWPMKWSSSVSMAAPGGLRMEMYVCVCVLVFFVTCSMVFLLFLLIFWFLSSSISLPQGQWEADAPDGNSAVAWWEGFVVPHHWRDADEHGNQPLPSAAFPFLWRRSQGLVW